MVDVEPVADVPGIDEGVEEVVEVAELIILKAAAKVCGFGVGEYGGEAWGELGDGDVCACDFEDGGAGIGEAVLLELEDDCAVSRAFSAFEYAYPA